MVACEMPWDSASRLKAASQVSKLPVLRQFSCVQAAGMPVNRKATALHADPNRRMSESRIVCVRLLTRLLFTQGYPSASDILPTCRPLGSIYVHIESN